MPCATSASAPSPSCRTTAAPIARTRSRTCGPLQRNTVLASPTSIDETQEVAKAYDAQCTPDFFGFNAADELQYRGRLDASRTTLVANARRDLYEAMKQVAETGRGPQEQMP